MNACFARACVVVSVAVSFGSAVRAADFTSTPELPKAVERFGARAEISFKVVDADGRPVEGATVCGVETDSSGVAVYRGIVTAGTLAVTVSAPNIYIPVVAPVELRELSGDKKSFASTNVPAIVVRKKKNPHPMLRGRVDLRRLNHERPYAAQLNTEWFHVDAGVFPGDSQGWGYAGLVAGYIVLKPKDPEDGFQEVEAYPDSLGTPAVAPSDGYRAGPFEMMLRTDGSSRSPARTRLVAFRHRTEAGFVYGILKVDGRNPGQIEYLVNRSAGEMSLEPEDCR